MPEGHVIHRVARDHHRWFVGEPLAISSPQGRFADEAAQLDGDSLRQVEAHGKHLFYHWQSGPILHIHLGLYGKFRPKTVPLPEPVGAVRIRLVGATRGFDLHGPNRCELIGTDDYATVRARLGADPLRADADPEPAWQRISNSKAALGTLLMNQEIIAGIGNIYRCELLFALRMHPTRPGRELTRDQFDEMWQTLQTWFRIGLQKRKIITRALPRKTAPTQSRRRSRELLSVYKHAHCPECGDKIRQWSLANRTVYACESCQV